MSLPGLVAARIVTCRTDALLIAQDPKLRQLKLEQACDPAAPAVPSQRT